MIDKPPIIPQHVGWIEVICGGMFSGKKEELIRRGKPVPLLFRPEAQIEPKNAD